MDLNKFIGTRISKSDASTVLKMHGKALGDYREQYLNGTTIEKNRCFHQPEAVESAKRNMSEKALALLEKPEYISSFSVDYCQMVEFQEYDFGLKKDSTKRVVIAGVSGMALIRKSEADLPDRGERE